LLSNASQSKLPSVKDLSINSFTFPFGAWLINNLSVVLLVPLIESETDELTSVIGVFGKFQVVYTVLYGLSSIVSAFSGLGTKFLTYEVDFWCSRPDELNVSVAEWLNMSAPMIADSDKFDR